MTFLLDNLYLLVIALVSGGLLLWPLIRKGGGATALTPLEATQLINHRNAIVVDLRDDKDFALGSLAGARSLPFAALAERVGELARFKARPALVVCDNGQQSARAVAAFKTQGFDEVHSLAGGVSAWRQAGLPLVQSGRDAGRQAVKDPQRKAGREQRPGDRNRGARTPKREAPSTLPAAVEGSGAAEGGSLVADDGAPEQRRVKETS